MNAPDPALFLIWSRALIALALIQQSLEYIAMREQLRRFKGRFSGGAFYGLVWLQLLLAACLWLPGSSAAFIVPLLFTFHLLIAVHFRGNFNGGADSMGLVLLSGLALTSLQDVLPAANQIALIYIATQSLLSYFVAGLVKLRSADWRSGVALQDFLQNSSYAVPEDFQRLSKSRPLLRAASWLIIAFEMVTPAFLLRPQALQLWIAVALVFHLGNFWLFALNRFLFVWMASYPSLLYLQQFLTSQI